MSHYSPCLLSTMTAQTHLLQNQIHFYFSSIPLCGRARSHNNLFLVTKEAMRIAPTCIRFIEQICFAETNSPHSSFKHNRVRLCPPQAWKHKHPCPQAYSPQSYHIDKPLPRFRVVVYLCGRARTHNCIISVVHEAMRIKMPQCGRARTHYSRILVFREVLRIVTPQCGRARTHNSLILVFGEDMRIVCQSFCKTSAWEMS